MVKDLDRESSKVKHYRKYPQRQAADTEGKPTGATEPDNCSAHKKQTKT